MATTLAALRDKVRYSLRDTTMPYHVESDELNECIRAAMTRVAGRVDLGETWASAAVTLTAGSDTATLPSTVEYRMVSALRRTSDGHLLTKRSQDELERLFWHGKTVADATHADPTDYAMSESAANVVTLRFQAPVDDEATLDMRRSVLPSDLSADSDTAPLSALLEQAVADFAAADVIEKLTDNVLDQLRLSRRSAASLVTRAAMLVRDEVIRKDDMHSTGRVQRYVV